MFGREAAGPGLYMEHVQMGQAKKSNLAFSFTSKESTVLTP